MEVHQQIILTSVVLNIALAVFIAVVANRFIRKFDELKIEFQSKYDAFENKFDRRFESIDRKFEVINRKFEAVDRKFEAIDHRFESMDRKFEAINTKMEKLQNLMLQYIISRSENQDSN